MTCPKCQSDRVKVLETRPVRAGLRRRRHCLACEHKFSTIEQVVPDRLHHTGPLAIVPRGELVAARDQLQSLLASDVATDTDDKEVA